jgi:RimK family alpha-L-glutamate ligase
VSAPRVVIFSGDTGWHEERLAEAFARRGVASRVVALSDCRISLGAPARGLHVPGFEESLPDGAFVRAIPDGSFEQVTFRLDILHALQDCGVPVYNPARAIEQTVDKGMTSFLLGRAGIPTPPTWIIESEAEARRRVTQELSAGRRLVLKPLFGNCGRGLVLVDAPEKLPGAEPVEGVWYLQQFVERPPGPCRDWRVFVIGGRAAAAMERVSSHWITNRARGAQCVPAVINDELRALAERSAAIAGTCYTGVDIILGADGRYLVLEVNGVPAWRGLQSVHETDIAGLLADDLLGRLRPARLSSNTG